ncbi:MAG TPA: DUF1876 domain-containing protein [Solirubrobacteraceae bacterium]|nr:DUF1876 domain-containing protein [Solirubrobacteraceae bacterium]
MPENFDIQITVGLVEDGTQTRASVVLRLAGKQFEGVGLARRAPDDPSVPEVGEELAASRAFSDLAHQLLDAATERISTFGT